MKAKESESDIQSEILSTLGLRRDVRVWRINAGTARSFDGARIIQGAPAGHADIAGILRDGRALYIEVKTPTGRQSEHQASFESMVKRFNGVYILARSVDEAVAAVEAALKGVSA